MHPVGLPRRAGVREHRVGVAVEDEAVSGVGGDVDFGTPPPSPVTLHGMKSLVGVQLH